MTSYKNNNSSDEWYTPKYIFDALECKFNLDAAAPLDRKYCHVPADKFLISGSLVLDWSGFVWLNPPFSGYGNKMKWLDKMIDHGNGILLTPDRTQTDWYQKAVKKSDCFLLLSKKVKFIKSDGSIGKQPGNGTTLFAFGQNGISALIKAEKNGLGILAVKNFE